MSTEEAKEYVDLVVDTLAAWGVIPQDRYGKMNEVQRDTLARLVADKSEE